MSFLAWLDPKSIEPAFPDVEAALTEPNGLLAVGGDLSPQRLIMAYRQGIFPWYNEDQPILWWSPNPRAVLFPPNIKISRSLRKTINKKIYTVTFDQCFGDVISACAAPRDAHGGTWITSEIHQAYCLLHELGYAHSVETWHRGALVGGLYGIAIGRVFFGESMFSRMTDASKVALVALARQLHAWEYALIDCQVSSDHLASLGAAEIPRQRFIQLLNEWCNVKGQVAPWHMDDSDFSNSRST